QAVRCERVSGPRGTPVDDIPADQPQRLHLAEPDREDSGADRTHGFLELLEPDRLVHVGDHEDLEGPLREHGLDDLEVLQYAMPEDGGEWDGGIVSDLLREPVADR